MASLWLVPVDEESFQQTLSEPIDLLDWENRPKGFPREARIWGVRTDPEQGEWPRNTRNWEMMESDDPLLFYRNNKSQYDAIGRVGVFAHTTYIRENYWNGGPAIDIYTVENYDDSVGIQPEEVNQILDYAEGFRPNGLWRVSPDRPVDKLLNRLDLK